jgi:hypothetical protein
MTEPQPVPVPALAPATEPQSKAAWPRLRRAVAFFAFGLFVAGGCSSTEKLSFEPARVKGSVCANPPERCDTSNECPMGTSCREPDQAATPLACADAAAGAASGTPKKQCLLEGSTASSTALSQRFATRRLDLIRDEGGTFRYDVSSSTRYVTCALFGCEPEVAPDATGRLVIENWDRCVIRYNVGASNKGTFDPQSDVYETPTESNNCSDTDAIHWPRYAQLSVGCWSYDDSALMAASPLFKLDPTALANIGGTGTSIGACPGRPDGSDCLLDSTSMVLGSCVEGECRDRCVTATDCEKRHLAEESAVSDAQPAGGAGAGGAGGSEGGSATNPPCRWQCQHVVAASALGTCVEQP